METAWIQVFVLTLTQCIAPAGKMVCEEETVQFQFADQVHCEVALVQMLDVSARVDNVIVKRESSHCRAAAKELKVFSNAAEASVQFEGAENLAMLETNDPPLDFTQSAHQERLKTLQNCDDVAGIAPCKIGEIIIEAAAESEDSGVWRRQN